MQVKEFEALTKSEIKKVSKAGNGNISEYSASKSIIDGFYNVECLVFDTDIESIISTVEIKVCMFDRRRSFVTTVNGEWVA